MNTQAKEIAETINSQISTNCKMACGIRERIYGEDEQHRAFLQVKVTIKPSVNHHIRVYLDHNDTYTVTLFHTRAAKTTTDYMVSDIYCDMLDDVIYTMCNGIFKESDYRG